MTADRRRWTAREVEALGLTTDVPTAGSVLGIGRETARGLARSGRFPVKVIEVGRLRRVSVRALLDILDPDEASRPGADPASSRSERHADQT